MERKPLFTKKSATIVRSETFALVVESYDLDSKPQVVIGKRMGTDETVRVFLREDVEYNRSGRHGRTEIATFAAPRKDRQHPGTTPGGILLIEDGQKVSDGVYGARWIQSLSHTPGEAEVIKATIHVSPIKYGKKTPEFPDGRPYSVMTILHNGDFNSLSEDMADALKLTPPFKVDNVKDLKAAISELLTDGLGVGVRVTTGDAFDAVHVNRKRDQSVDDAVRAFMESLGDLSADIDEGKVSVEVIPYGSVWAGPATLDVMAQKKAVQARINWYNDIAEGRDQKTYPVAVYRESLVALRLSKPDENGRRSVFFTHFEPLRTREPVRGLVNAVLYAQTEHLSPTPPKPEAAAPKQADADPEKPSANDASTHDGAPDSSFGSFDGSDFSDDNIMGAADTMAEASSHAEPEAAQPEAPARSRAMRYAGRR